MPVLYLEDNIAYWSIVDSCRRDVKRFNGLFPKGSLILGTGDILVSQGTLYSELLTQRELFGLDGIQNTHIIPQNTNPGERVSLAQAVMDDGRLMDVLRKESRRCKVRSLVPTVLTYSSGLLAKELGLGICLLPPPGMEAGQRLNPGLRYLEEHPVRTLNSKITFTEVNQYLDTQNSTDFAPSSEAVFTMDALIKSLRGLAQQGEEVFLKQDINMGGEGNYHIQGEDLAEIDFSDYASVKVFLENIMAVRGLQISDGLLVQPFYKNVLLNPSLEFYCTGSQPPDFVYDCQMDIDEDQHYMGAVIPDLCRIPGMSFNHHMLQGKEAEYRRLMSKVRARAAALAGIYQDEGYRGICDFDIIVYFDGSQLSAKIVEMNIGRETGATLDHHLLHLAGKSLGPRLYGISSPGVRTQGGLKGAINDMGERVFGGNGGFIITGYNGGSRISLLEVRKY